MNFMELAKNRYSERYFDPRPVEEEKLRQILEAGRIVPTACNYQPQRFYVFRTEAALEKIRALIPSHFGAPLMLLVCYDADVVWHNKRERLFPDYNSGEQDAAIAATTMMYEAEELGVHSVWLRGFDALTLREGLALPENHIPVMMFAMGYPSDRSKPHPWHALREPIEHFVTEM